MAVKPNDSDTFLREVDDELRREKVTSFVARHGWKIVAAAVLLLAAIGGWIWWQHRQNVKAGEDSQKLSQVIEQLEARNARGAAAGIDELAQSDRDGYRIAALFARANAQISTNAIPAAIETLKSIAADGDAPQPYRDAALIRQTQLEFDTMSPGAVVQRLQPFAQAGNPWHGTAGEMVGIAYIKANRMDQAARTFEALAKDPGVPETIRARAVQMASSLGVDAVQMDPEFAKSLEAAAAAPPTPALPAGAGAAPAPAQAQPAAPAKQ